MHADLRLRLGILLTGVVALLFGCVPPPPPPKPAPTEPTLRVLLEENCASISLTAVQPPLIRVAGADAVRRLDLDPNTTVALSLRPSGWRVNDVELGSGVIEIDPAADGSVRLDGHAYHGRLRLIPHGQERFDVVNDLGVENYLKGVLARELLRQWDVQTYEAQAVVARTYAIYEIRSASPNADFDVYADQRSQMYGGIDGESPRAREAVETTFGQVVVAGLPGERHIFKAYFCSCCGGIGQSATDAFGDPPSPELAAQRNGTLCSASPNYTWGPVEITKLELTRRFHRFGQLRNRPDVTLGAINHITPAADNGLGRPVKFTVSCVDGRHVTLSGEELRWAINTDAPPASTLKSSLLTLDDRKTSIRFSGHGFGHGVGMCQWTAQRRAELGMSYDQIVTAAFPSSSVVKAY